MAIIKLIASLSNLELQDYCVKFNKALRIGFISYNLSSLDKGC